MTLLAYLLAFLLVAVIAVPIMILSAFAIQVGWVWFIHPIFPGTLESLSLLQAMGLSIVVSIFTYRATSVDDDKAESILFKTMSFYAIYFLAAIIIHSLMP